MKTQKEITDYLLGFEGVRLSDNFGEKNIAFVVTGEDDKEKLFALILDDSRPLRLSLRCDEILAKKLRDDFESILPGQDLDKKTWNTIICTGQVPTDLLSSLILLSYNLTKGVN